MVYHDYKVRDKAMLVNNAAYKYEMPYNGWFVITQCWTNVMVTLQYGATKIGHIIHCLKPYTSDTNVEDINIGKNVWW